MQYPNKDSSFKDFSLAVIDVKNYLARRILFIIVVSFVTLTIGFCYSFFEPNKFAAEFKFTNDVPQEERIDILNNFSQKVGVITANRKPFYDGTNIIGLLKSRRIITETLNDSIANSGFSKTTFFDEYLHNHFPGLSLNTKKGIENGSNRRLKDSLMNVIYGQIVNNQLTLKKEGALLDLIGYSFVDSKEEFAKNFSDALFKKATQYYQQYKLTRLYKQESILMTSIDSLKKVIDTNIDAIALNADEGLDVVKVKALISLRKTEALNVSNKSYYEELVKELEIIRISIKNEKPLFKIVEYPVYPLLNKKLTFAFVLPVFFLGGLFLAIIILLIKRIVDNPLAIVYLPEFKFF